MRRQEKLPTDPREVLLRGTRAGEVLRACEKLAEKETRQLEEVVDRAVRGGRAAVRSYVRTSRRLTRRLLSEIHESHSELVAKRAGRFLVIDAKGQPVPFSPDLMELWILDAPFSPWVTIFGAGRGTVLSLINRLRTILPFVEPLPIPSRKAVLPHWENLHRQGLLRFHSLAQSELQSSESSVVPLGQAKRLFDLSLTELGRLFGASRQAVTGWFQHGVPPARRPKLNTVLNIAELLQRKLKPGRLPGVARKPASAYGGLSMLQMIEADRHEELLHNLRRSFEWSATA